MQSVLCPLVSYANFEFLDLGSYVYEDQTFVQAHRQVPAGKARGSGLCEMI